VPIQAQIVALAAITRDMLTLGLPDRSSPLIPSYVLEGRCFMGVAFSMGSTAKVLGLLAVLFAGLTAPSPCAAAVGFSGEGPLGLERLGSASSAPGAEGWDEVVKRHRAALEALERSGGASGERLDLLEEAAAILYLRLGRRLEALPYLEEAWRLRVAASRATEGNRARQTRSRLLAVYRALHSHEQSEEVQRQAIAELEGRDGHQRELAVYLRALARHLERVRPADDEIGELHRRAIEYSDVRSRPLAQAGLARWHSSLGWHDEAIALFEEAVAELERAGDLSSAASMRSDLAVAYDAVGRAVEAEAQLAAIRAFDELLSPPDHAHYVRGVRSTVGELVRGGRLVEARERARRSLAALEASHGHARGTRELQELLDGLERRARGVSLEASRDSRSCAGARLTGAFLELQREGRILEAIDLSAAHLRSAELEHGPISRQVASVLEQQSVLLSGLDNAAAFAAAERRMEILEELRGPGGSEVAGAAAWLARLAGSFDPPAPPEHFRRLEVVSLEVLEGPTLELARAWLWLGHAQRAKSPGAAAHSFREAMNVAELAQGPESALYRSSRQALAESLAEAERWEEAEPLLRELAVELERREAVDRNARAQLRVVQRLLRQVPPDTA
jgi:tetratricopeptide (TPR) repeat protein